MARRDNGEGLGQVAPLQFYPSPPAAPAVTGAAPAPPETQAADGRWTWDGTRWRPVPGATPSWLAPYRSPRKIAFLAMAVLALEVIANVGTVVMAVPIRLDVLPGTAVPDAYLWPLLVLGNLRTLLLVGEPGLLAWWAFRCCRNLGILGARDLRWSPGWAACGWFLPVAGLVIPYLVLREVWTATTGTRRSLLVHLWGAAWIARGLIFMAFLGLNFLDISPPGLGMPPIIVALFVALFVAVLGLLVVSDVLSGLLVYRLTAGQDAASGRVPTAPPAPPVPLPAWARAYQTPRPRAAFAVAALAVAALGQLLLLAVNRAALALEGVPATSGTRPVLQTLVVSAVFAGVPGFVIAPTAVAMWTHRTYRNLAVLGGSGLAWSPRWAAAAWFVPFVNLAVPYAIVRDVWSFCRPAGTGPRLPVLAWWLTWTVGIVLSLLSTTLLAFYSHGIVVEWAVALLGMVADVALAVAATLAIAGIVAVTRQQQAMAGEPVSRAARAS